MSSTDRPRRIDHVAIIGGGFSGSLLAINLVRHGMRRVTLIERCGGAGRGVAYSAADPCHLLNVRAGNMSALPDDADHFLRWLAVHHPEIQGFAPRLVYGDYLSALMHMTQQQAGTSLDVRQDEARDIRIEGDGVHVMLGGGETIHADLAVLAPGNLPPHEPDVLTRAALGADRYVADPWSGDVAGGLGSDDTILAIGSGLTMVDMALLLEGRGFTGRIIALSRRGLLPRAHADHHAAAGGLSERPRSVATSLLRAVRARSRDIGWRAAIDELRPFTQDIWLGAAIEERARFLRHLRPWWDVHRHRLAPQVAARIDAMRARGQLEIAAGKLTQVKEAEDGLSVRWRPRGSTTTCTRNVRRIVNCSGPQGDLTRTEEPLLRHLVAAGTIRPDPLHIGIDVNARSEAIGGDGCANPRLIAIGPPTRGTFWEIVAIPDIRVQAWAVARRLTNAQWVEGEGL